MIIHGDNLEALKEFPDNYFHSVVTDPPYGLSFMGKKWDYDVPNTDIWREVLRVLKPGGHLLSFGGTRTYHRLVVAIEDAGFEIRDQIQWIYGSGFPKSHNIKEGDFKGWGTALKPANEPICLARKPLEGTVAQNVQTWGTGAINVDASRIGFSSNETDSRIGTNALSEGSKGKAPFGVKAGGDAVKMYKNGRWPANVIFDEEAAAMLDEQSGHLHGAGNKADVEGGIDNGMFGNGITRPKRIDGFVDMSGGGASRFFYCAKASKRERNEGLDSPSTHPTVKPIRLMEYLIRLITPPAGIVLDPFCGSGSTGVAATRLGFGFVGIEMEKEYCDIAEKRLEGA